MPTVDKSILSVFEAVAASDTAEPIVTGIPGKKIRVLGVVINHGDTTASAVTFNSATTAISATLKGPANGGFVLPVGGGWFETARGDDLTVTTGAGSTTNIHVVYTPVS
jgi:hypothetical protein